jgi:hypothetical protein
MALLHAFESLITPTLLAGAPGISRARLSLVIDDNYGEPTDRLIDLCFEAARFARVEDLSVVSAQITDGPRWPDV